MSKRLIRHTATMLANATLLLKRKNKMSPRVRVVRSIGSIPIIRAVRGCRNHISPHYFVFSPLDVLFFNGDLTF